MPINYKSTVYESNPYTLPVDLNLLQKVNSYKQTLFYKNAESIKQQYGEIQNSDILNSEQKNYLLGKMNNLTTQINNMGGIDYSDMNITNQIEGFGSEIYNDPTVLKGITSTKLIREFNKNVEKMQTDPKLSKFYNVSNITRIQEQMIKPYVDGDITASYSGPSAPRPYEGNPFEKMLKNMKNLPPDIIVTASANGPALYNVQTKKFLSDQDISATFDGLIDSNMKAQLMDDAWYNFDYSTGYKFDEPMGQSLYTDELLNKKRNYEEAISGIDIELKTNIDPEKRALYEAKKAEYSNSLNQVSSEIQKGNNEFSKLWKKDPETAKYSLYLSRFRNDVIKAAGYSQEKNDYVKNEEYAWQKRKEIALINQGLMLDSQGNLMPLPNVKKGKGKDGTDSDGNDPLTGFYNVGSSYRDDDELKELKVDQESINQEINQFKIDNNIDAKTIIKELVSLNGWEKEMGYNLTVNTTGQGSPQTLSSDLITKVTGVDNYLDRNDLQAVVNQASTQGFNKGAKQFKIKHDGREFGMTYEQVNILNQLNTAWRDYASGKIDKLPDSFNKADFIPKFDSFVSKHKLRELNIATRKQYINSVYSTVFKNKGLSDTDINEYQEWIASGKPSLSSREKEYFSGNTKGANNKYYYVDGIATNASGTPSIKATALGKKIERIHKLTDKSLNSAFETAAKNINFYEYMLSDKTKVDGIVTKIQNERLNNKESADKTKIDPLSIVRAEDGLNYKVFYAYDSKEKKSITISPAEALNFNLSIPSNQILESYFKYGAKESPELYLKPKTVQGIKPVLYKIKMHDGGTFIPYVNKNGTYYPVSLPERASSASDAEKYLIQLATSATYKSQEDFLNNVTKPIQY